MIIPCPVRVLHLIKSLGRGGAETLLPECLKLHNQQKYEFHYLYFLPWKDQMVQSLKVNGGIVNGVEAAGNIQMLLRAKDVINYVRDNNIHLIHAHLPWAGILARYVGIKTGIPVIYTEHNKQERYHFATRWMNLATMNRLRRIIAVSKDVENSIHRYKPGLKPPVETVLNGVNIDHFAPALFERATIRDSLSLPGDSIIIGTIAVFRAQKRLDIWMEVAREIAQRDRRVHFIIVGDGPLKNELLQKCSSLGMTDRIHFAGLQQEVRPYLAAFDIFMMASMFEGLPIALLEAMAMECPVISTDAGGIKEVIRDEVDGLLCSVDAPRNLVDLASRLLTNEMARRDLGKAARSRVEKSFAMGNMVFAIEQIYDREVQRPAGA